MPDEPLCSARPPVLFPRSHSRGFPLRSRAPDRASPAGVKDLTFARRPLLPADAASSAQRHGTRHRQGHQQLRRRPDGHLLRGCLGFVVIRRHGGEYRLSMLPALASPESPEVSRVVAGGFPADRGGRVVLGLSLGGKGQRWNAAAVGLGGRGASTASWGQAKTCHLAHEREQESERQRVCLVQSKIRSGVTAREARARRGRAPRPTVSRDFRPHASVPCLPGPRTRKP